ncbi:COPII vesicle protein [Plasmopara halstedii]|uniref:COPII vesicle protein n=1 Tax=Plasmopara halstedii TaxID=4781 RepID=A0A0P1AX79_PLAHL|nr:COPII vesicle protein [Plasmopara halstedii]CEG45653.1 COPII vesicle protein [Plasmopara halstedii]|eukprot:XP_024582022.1 COPII vesicle protein [Plasmopara halstedii]
MTTGSSSWLSRLKRLDAYPKTIDEFKTDTVDKMMHDIMHDIEKISLDPNGQALTEAMRDVIGGALTNHTDLHKEAEKPACGSCYSAGEPGECCNTCESVKVAYDRKSWMMPSLHTIAQCQENEIEKVLRGEVNEGCRIKGALVVSKAAGRLYFAPSKFFRSGYLSSQDLVDATFKVFDTSHTIHSLSFGELYPDMNNPLNNRQKQLPETSRGSFQYFLKIVPTEYTFLSADRISTNQFSATEHFRELTPAGDNGLPMVAFSYSFSPIMFRIEQYRVGFLQFLTSVCAIVGGVFTILGIMDSLAFGFSNKTSTTTLL